MTNNRYKKVIDGVEYESTLNVMGTPVVRPYASMSWENGRPTTLQNEVVEKNAESQEDVKAENMTQHVLAEVMIGQSAKAVLQSSKNNAFTENTKLVDCDKEAQK